MGGSTYSSVDQVKRNSFRSFSGIDTFQYSKDVSEGKVKKGVHPTLNPKGVQFRESRDSTEHPLTLPIGILLDTTGSMSKVPEIIQKKLPALMGILANESGKKSYIGQYYPAILMGAVDDYYAMRYDMQGGEGSLQVGQFESGIEIDDNLTNLWLTRNGGGSGEESYDLGMYFFARHTATDHWERRSKKGYLFVIGDERPYTVVQKQSVADVMGDYMEVESLPFAELAKELQERYNVYFIIPNMTSHFGDKRLRTEWQKYLPADRIIDLQEPGKICELIASTVALDLKEASPEEMEVLSEEARRILI